MFLDHLLNQNSEQQIISNSGYKQVSTHGFKYPSETLFFFKLRDHNDKLYVKSIIGQFPKDSAIILYKFLKVLLRTENSNRCHASRSIKAKTKRGEWYRGSICREDLTARSGHQLLH